MSNFQKKKKIVENLFFSIIVWKFTSLVTISVSNSKPSEMSSSLKAGRSWPIISSLVLMLFACYLLASDRKTKYVLAFVFGLCVRKQSVIYYSENRIIVAVCWVVHRKCITWHRDRAGRHVALYITPPVPPPTAGECLYRNSADGRVCGEGRGGGGEANY